MCTSIGDCKKNPNKVDTIPFDFDQFLYHLKKIPFSLIFQHDITYFLGNNRPFFGFNV